MKSCLLSCAALAALSSFVPAQIPGTYTPYGTACGSGTTKPTLTARKLPVVGREFVATASGLIPNTVGFFVVGASNTTWNGTPLPLDLTFLGAPGCRLYASLDIVVPTTSGRGVAYFQTRIPYGRNLAGVNFFQQYYGADPRANRAGLAFSNGARGVVGHCLCLQEEAVVEDFTAETMLDKPNSGGAWFGGKAFGALVGGTGIHGAFDPKIGRALPDDVFVFSTDRMTIPATHTESGVAIVVTNGVFEFSAMRVPVGVTVRFEGSNPVTLKVRGDAVIDGRIDCSGADSGFFAAVPNPALPPVRQGQPGARGGPGGGAGGKGGDSCQNTGANPLFDGRDGADVQLPGGHGYAAGAVGTGGKGSPHWPRNGRLASTDYCALSNNFGSDVAAGGGGGGFVAAGRDGVATRNPCNQAARLGTNPNSGGIRFDIGSLAPRSTGSNRSVDHYGVGGAGGGGGGSHSLLTRRTLTPWPAGSGGAGGGGLCIVRVGRQLTMGTAASVLARGGSGYVIDGVRRPGEGPDGLFNVPSPSGGGSGGTVLLQIGVNYDLRGQVDCGGGKGGVLDNSSVQQPALLANARGGDGGAGYIRLENPVIPRVADLGRTVPAATNRNVGRLTDRDTQVTTQSLFYNTGLGFTPHFVRYEIEAELNGRKVLYSDDPRHQSPIFIGRADAGQAVQFRIQGATLDQRTNSETWRGAWRDSVRTGLRNSLGSDPANAWRFQLVYDRSVTTSVVVTKVSIVFQR